jgi:alkylated DNA nucleotide flippase Atl1
VSPDPELVTVEEAAEILGVPAALVIRRMQDGRLPWLRVCRREDARRLKEAEDEQTAALRVLGENDDADWMPGREWFDIRGGRRDLADITWLRLRLPSREDEEGRIRQVLASEIFERQPTSDLETLSLWQLLSHLAALNVAVTLTISPAGVSLTVRSER